MVSVNNAQTRMVGKGSTCPPAARVKEGGQNNTLLPTLHTTPVPTQLAQVYRAWLRARRGKKPSANQLLFASNWAQRLHTLTSTLRAGAWQPARTVSFVVTHPKTREIHAPDFADRVVHHWLVPHLEALYEPIFIHHSYANRKGKGSHGAVDALQGMMRAQPVARSVGWVLESTQALLASDRRVGFSPPSLPVDEPVLCADGGLKPTLQNTLQNTPYAHHCQSHYLQLDIHNFFNSIHRATLLAMLRERLDQAQHRRALSPERAQALHSLCYKLLAKPTPALCRNPALARLVPPHKRLTNAARDCGIPVGNLTSQFFANVYLNALDQFVKHTLKVKHYVRYVDDFVLLSHSKVQLQAWKAQIETFLAHTLKLRLKAGSVLQACSQGIDFLGYRVFYQHRWVRPRVVRHARVKLAAWWQQYASAHRRSAVTPAAFAALQALLGSYWGHFSHANSTRLKQGFFSRFPWLHDYFELAADGSITPNAPARWVVRRHQALRRHGFVGRAIAVLQPASTLRRVGFSPPSSQGAIPLVG